MARLWSSGFELNSLTDGVEIDSSFGQVSIDSSIKRSGSYSLKCLGTGINNEGVISKQFTGASVITFFRIYFYLNQSTDTFSGILQILDDVGDSIVGIVLNSNDTLNLRNEFVGSNIGSPSVALTHNTWYCIELKIDLTNPAATVVDARLNQVSFASGTVNFTSASSTGSQAFNIGIGVTNSVTAGIGYFDDIAVNDNSGSFQNSYPGAGSIIHLRPNGDGENANWSTSGGTTHNTLVNEVTPDDNSTYVISNTLNNEDLYDVDNSSIGASDTVNVVAVGVRFANDTADATTAFKLEIEKANGGTKTQSAAIIPNSTSWKSNAIATPFNYSLTTYQDPVAANWTQTTVDSMRIGAKITTGGTHNIQISTLWALVDSTPAGITTSTSTTTSTTTTSTSTTSTSTSSSTSRTTSTTTTSTSTSQTTSTSTTSTSTSKTTSTSTTSTSSSSSTSLSTSTSTTSTSTSSSTTQSTTTSTSTSSSTSTTTTVPYNFVVDQIDQQYLT